MLIIPVTTEDDQRMIETCLVFLKMLSFFLKAYIEEVEKIHGHCESKNNPKLLKIWKYFKG